MSNREKFREAYIEKLHDQLDKHPEEYFYKHEQVEAVVDKMIPSLARGGAHVGAAAKAAARKCGIKPTVKAIMDFLKEEAP